MFKKYFRKRPLPLNVVVKNLQFFLEKYKEYGKILNYNKKICECEWRNKNSRSTKFYFSPRRYI